MSLEGAYQLEKELRKWSTDELLLLNNSVLDVLAVLRDREVTFAQLMVALMHALQER